MKKILLPMMLVLIFPAFALAEETFVQDKHGCQLMANEDFKDLTHDWKGKCKSGYAEGAGLLLVSNADGDTLSEKVTFRKGRREGHSSARFPDGDHTVRTETEYKHGVLNGKAVVYLSSGDVLEMNCVDGVVSKQITWKRKDGSRVEGIKESAAVIEGKQFYPNGDEYEGTMTADGTRHGMGKFTKQGGQPQAGEFILDEFVDVNDEAIKALMPARFGLELGMTKQQVAALTGEMTESTSSIFRNAYEVQHFPNEKINVSNMTLGKHTVYFDEEGKLWRIWAEILLEQDTYFGGGEVMQAYGTIKKWLSLTNDALKSVETHPHYGEDISSCRDVADWEKDNPESFSMAQHVAPRMAHAQRVIFDIECGAIPFWNSTYLSKDGKERYSINIRYGNLYATPLAYSAAVGNEDEMTKRMRKTAEQKK